MKNYFLAGIILLLISLGVAFMVFRKKSTETALFAGGCFWCSQAAFESINGVQKVVVGYTGGTGKNPTYQTYAQQGHVEAFQVTYNPKKISYKQLVDAFWKTIDPTDKGGQFGDRGTHYRTIIFYANEQQKQDALKSKKKLEQSKRFTKPIVTELVQASTFYEAEKYHKNYYKKNPDKYKAYKKASGREAFFQNIWPDRNQYQKPSDQELKKMLTPLQYKVTQEDGTEPAFNNKYWDNEQKGIYVDIVSDEPLFSSQDKFKSGTGWPSFTKPLEKENIIEKDDRRLLTIRTEVRSKQANSHLGHLFQDGPPPTGLRYCVNSAALLFIPIKDLEKKGYGKYLHLFEK